MSDPYVYVVFWAARIQVPNICGSGFPKSMPFIVVSPKLSNVQYVDPLDRKHASYQPKKQPQTPKGNRRSPFKGALDSEGSVLSSLEELSWEGLNDP